MLVRCLNGKSQVKQALLISCRIALFLLIPSCFCAYADDGWRLRLIDDVGFDDVHNVGVVRMASRGDSLYLGTWNSVSGTKVYRLKGEVWERINEGGFGDRLNFTTLTLIWFKDWLYVGSWRNKGAQLYRGKADAPSAEDVKWEPVTTDGFGKKGLTGFTHCAIFKDMLYLGCLNEVTGPEIWRSATGNPGDWAQVNPDGWGRPHLSDSTCLLVHDGYLYIGTESDRNPSVGTVLFRTDGNLEPPYDTWQTLCQPAFGGKGNVNICGLAVLDGKIYAGTWNHETGLDVWRATITDTAPFTDWELAAEPGFGRKTLIDTTTMTVFNDAIFLGAIGHFTYKGFLLGGNVKITSSAGGALMRSTDGRTWQEIDAPGFIEHPIIGVQWVTPHQGKLYVGAQALDCPQQLWVYEPAP